MRHVERRDGYLPIAAYGLVGDCRSAALIGIDGSVDWLCLPRFDDASIFGRILDADRGGYWRIAPQAPHLVEQRYRDRSNVLQTIFVTATGRVVVTDFMPVHPATIERHAVPHGEPRLVRVVECLGGEVVVRSEMHPAPDYGRVSPGTFRVSDGRLHADTGEHHICIRATAPLSGRTTTIPMASGEVVAFGLSCSHRGSCPGDAWDTERARHLLRQTQDFWWRWIGGCVYDGPYQEPVWRSALALKLMTYAPTGAIIAAPTTSLPETIGGERNWDYRYTWLRDASFTLYAFFQLQLTAEAHAFFQWLTRTGVGSDLQSVDNLYTVDGERIAGETVLEHLQGYRHSRPVRIGNGAARQLQLDVYGELLDSAYLYARFGGEIDEELWRDLRAIVELAIARWEQPDSSIWEVRGGPQHFTYSKVMCWVAVDRGLRIAERFRLPHDAERWRAARRAIHRRVTAQGWSERRSAFTQALGSEVLDAAVLRLLQVRFLPDHDSRLRQTVEAINTHLRDGELIRRYRLEETVDGVSGDEGGFLMCCFWLVDAWAHLGELERAQRHFERLLTFGSPVGLFSEEADPRTGELLGNYPQAFTHLSLVGAAVNIERARHRQLAPRGL